MPNLTSIGSANLSLSFRSNNSTNQSQETPRFLRCRFCNVVWRNKVAFENFSTVYMDKGTLRSKIWRARTFETSWDFANYNTECHDKYIFLLCFRSWLSILLPSRSQLEGAGLTWPRNRKPTYYHDPEAIKKIRKFVSFRTIRRLCPC